MRHNNYKGSRPQKSKGWQDRSIQGLAVTVRDGNLEQALRVFKRKVRKSGLIQELRDREFYTKPSEQRKLAKKRGRARWLKKKAKMELL